MSGETSAEDLLVLHGLEAGHGGTAVVHGIDLRVGPGEVVALLGPNGAGKTTTLLTVSGLLPLLGGEVTVLGQRLARRRRVRPDKVIELVRRGLAHVPEDRALFFDLTVRENIRLGHARGDRGGLDRALDLFPVLRPMLDRKAGLLSGGEQQMLALARALVGSPRLLMVDELSLGLAPIIVESLLPVLRTVARETGAGVLVVEQHVGLVLDVSDRAYLLDRGRIVLHDSAAALAADPDRLRAGYFGQARPA